MRRLAPPPDLLPSEWANRYRRLSPESSARFGRFRIELTPFMREPMDLRKDPECAGFVFKKSSQVAYSELLNNLIGYAIHMDPAPIMMMQPTLEMAEDFSKDRISPMIRDSPVLAERVDDRSRTSGNTILHKNFPGGLLQLVGANSPASLASRPIRDLKCDEVDRYPASAGKEGDPIWIGEQRQTTFPDRFTVIGGTPTIKGASRVCKDHEKSDQRVYMVPCPRCGDHIELIPSGIVRDEESEDFGKYRCQLCGETHENWEKLEIIRDKPAGGTAYWKPTNPESQTPGFFIWAAYSPFKTYRELAEKWNESEGEPELEQVFWNTMLGLEYEFSTQDLDHDSLFKRREDYAADRVPDQVAVITAGIDTQDDRFEGEVVGWGPGEESWSLDYFTIEGDPDHKDTRDRLDQFLAGAVYRRQDGTSLHIKTAFVDLGGHRTDAVYRFVRGKQHRGIFACKGLNTPGQPIFARWSQQKKARVRMAMIGTDTAKEIIYARLASENEDQRSRMHFPLEYSAEYFKGLISEEKRIEWIKGQPRIRWVKKKGATRRNEPLDVRVYAMAALRSIPMGARMAGLKRREFQLKKRAAATQEEPPDTTEATEPAEPAPPRKRAQKKTSNPRKLKGRRRGGWRI